MKNLISKLYQYTIFNEIDIRFAEFICKLDGNEDGVIFLSAALVSSVTGGGDICMDLDRYAQRVVVASTDTCGPVACPELSVWREKLTASTVVGRPGDHRPLILDSQNRLYLYRYWEYQQKLADGIRRKASNKMSGVNLAVLKDGLKRLFKSSAPLIDWQQIAAMAAVLNRFSVISGGPGTGKTYLVAKILALLLEQDGGSGLRIFLTAPTGKAAMKLSETIEAAIQAIPCPDAIRDAIPIEAATVHRLLKTIPHSPYFHHCEENPLPADVVVVDEASMIDLALMSKLFQAIPADARVILVGDRDQLASVEPGSVLGDICVSYHSHHFSENFSEHVKQLTGLPLNAPDIRILPKEGLYDSILTLHKNYRFSETGGIGGFSCAVKLGSAVDAAALLVQGDDLGLIWKDAPTAGALQAELERSILKEYSSFLQTTEPVAALEKFNNFQILCVLNKGPFGIQAVNHLTEQVLRRHGLISADHRLQRPWYRGRPVIITRNDYRLGLYNGDIGITLPDSDDDDDDGTLYVFFQGLHGETKRFIPQQLPEHATVYAMTVHKSQGSEFAKVLLILPDKDVAVLTRELIYTAVTRAREQVVICGSKPILQAAISRRIDRTSGLKDALWQ
ncbi:MAG: exodeoxyribonuclease V subunit alpha [Desulfobacterales bacterium]|nr:exodeoxyribonuclease V subunit alpha [Desulfobacterales bacterium]